MRLRELRQKAPAAWLTIALIGIPAIPVVIAEFVPEPPWTPVADGDTLAITSDAGTTISFSPPPDWEAQASGSAATFRSGDRWMTVEIHDRGDGDPDVAADRLLRLDRFSGIASGFDGGSAAVPNSDLSGPTCVVIADWGTGRCAILADDDIIVRITSIGSTDEPAAAFDAIVASINDGAD